LTFSKKAKESQGKEEEEEIDQRLRINDLIENKVLQKTFRRSSN
jgi:hypothetical protein